MRFILIFALTVLTSFSSTSHATDKLRSFKQEADRITSALKCTDPKTSPANPEMGLNPLYSCIEGRAQTVKLFINGKKGSDKVGNVKLMWNDWFKDLGSGIHADKSVAQRFVKTFSKLYAPEKESQIIEAFFGNANKSFETTNFKITYTFDRGPAINERMLVLTPKK
jgi:hypothetical protein